MKRNERHHLKENELLELASRTRDAIDARQREVGVAAIVVILIAVAVIGYFAWQSRVEGRAGSMLAEAVIVSEARVGPPPAPGTPATGPSFPTDREKYEATAAKFKAVADQYPSSDAGMFARYREGATHMALGNTKEAAAAYQLVIDRAGNSLYGQMARLGLAETQAREGQYDSAINTYRGLADNKDGPLPVDGILMQLGRTYREAGKTTEAQQTFNRVVEEFPESPFSGDARKELESLKKS
jgi:predicted negative regulator of RcsB-dependent stress response